MGSRAAKGQDFGSGNSVGSDKRESATRRFGVFELDLHDGELRRNGIRVKLQEQPFQVLAELLQHPGEVVTREDLRNRLWPADTFVDFDHSLNAAIRRLRDALGDSAENPTFVETVARRGYRFLAPVSGGPPDRKHATLEQEIPSVPPRNARSYRRSWMVGLIIAVVLMLLGVMVGLLLASRQPPPLRATRLTANPVDDPVRAAAISSDGRYLAFSDEAGFYLRQIDTGETHPLTLPPQLSVTFISWFPDSVHMIVALTARSRESSLWELSALGGTARKLVDDGRIPAVSPDGKKLAFVAGKAMRERIWLSEVDGTQARQLVGEDGDLFGALAWSPDSTRVAYTTAKFAYGRGVRAIVDVIGVHDQSPRTALPRISVLSRLGLDGPLSWTSDGRLIYAVWESRPRQTDSNLWSIRLDRHMKPEGAPIRLTNDPGAVVSVSSSGDSKRIVYVKGVPQPDVYVGKLASPSALAEPVRLTLDDRQDLPFDWTPDSSQVIFASDRTGSFKIYKQSLSQTVPDVLVGGTQQASQPRLSPDGTQLIYLVYPSWGDAGGEVPLMRVPLAGGTPQQIVKANWISNQQCARSPAGTCIYSVVGKNVVTFFTFDPFQGPGKQLFQITTDVPQLYNWSLSPDGTTLAIAKGKWADEETRIHLVSLNGAPERWLTIQGWRGLASLDWAADSKGLWAASTDVGGNSLLYIDLQGRARAVWHPQRETVGWAIPSRDGKYLALHLRSGSANAWMLERP